MVQCEGNLGKCSGVGSSKIAYIADFPIGIAGLPGVGRFTVLEEAEGQRIPGLTPVDILRKLNANIQLRSRGAAVLPVTRRDGGISSETLGRLDSGHITNNYLNFGKRGWHLPDKFAALMSYNPFL